VSYKPGTILERKTPFKEPEDGKPDLRPYNEVEVIGHSPVQTTTRATEWTGQAGDNLSIRPTSFGPVIDRPAGELQRDYNVVSIAEPERIDRQVVERVEPGPSPEEQFAKQALERGDEAPRREVPPADPDAPSPEEVFGGAPASMDTSVQRPPSLADAVGGGANSG
jgi:hypothetical protein